MSASSSAATCVTALLEVRCDPGLERGEPPFLEASGLGLGERLVRDVGQRSAAPERKCVARPARCNEAVELLDVELPPVDTQQVPRGPGHDPVRAERVPQGVDVHLKRV